MSKKGHRVKVVAIESELRNSLSCVPFWTYSPVPKFRVLACIGLSLKETFKETITKIEIIS